MGTHMMLVKYKLIQLFLKSWKNVNSLKKNHPLGYYVDHFSESILRKYSELQGRGIFIIVLITIANVRNSLIVKNNCKNIQFVYVCMLITVQKEIRALYKFSSL